MGSRERDEDDAVDGIAMLADPVPVFLPVRRELAFDKSSSVSVGGVAIGRTNVGLNLNASQRTSMYDTQLEMMRSPALGLQGSDRLSLPARLNIRYVYNEFKRYAELDGYSNTHPRLRGVTATGIQ